MWLSPAIFASLLSPILCLKLPQQPKLGQMSQQRCAPTFDPLGFASESGHETDANFPVPLTAASSLLALATAFPADAAVGSSTGPMIPSAIAAYGAFFIPKAYGTSIALTGSPVGALCGFLVFYAVCLVLTWVYYTRKGGLLYGLERGISSGTAIGQPA